LKDAVHGSIHVGHKKRVVEGINAASQKALDLQLGLYPTIAEDCRQYGVHREFLG
jgi:hypothetical protein